MTERTPGPGQARIVVGVDGSQPSMCAIRWAAAQAETTGAALEAVLTWDLPMDAYGPMPASYDVRTQSAQELGEIVRDIRGEFPGIDVSSTVIEGSAGRALVAAAKGAELLVVGSRGHRAVVGILLGSVSEYCITHAGCPVVVVRPDKQATSHEHGPVGSATRRF